MTDVDGAYRRALESGATSLYEPADRPYGDREAGVRDPAGNYWFLARHLSGDYKDPGMQDVAPCLFPRGAPEFLDFLEKAFGAETIGRHQNPAGMVLHASVKIGDSILAMGEAHGQWQPMPGAIHLYLPDVDAAYRRAMEAGAVSISAPANHALRRSLRGRDRSARELLVSGVRRLRRLTRRPAGSRARSIPVMRVSAYPYH